MKSPKSIVTSLLFLIVIAFFIWAAIPSPDNSKLIAQRLENEKNKADVLFTDAVLAEIFDGVKYWELIAKTSSLNRSTGISNLRTVNGTFFTDGKPSLKFIAPKAAWQMKKSEIRLNDPIGFDVRSEKFIREQLLQSGATQENGSIFHLPTSMSRTIEGYWFQAKVLDWKLSTKKLLCTGNITLTKGNATINSEKLVADVGLENVELTGNPTGKMNTNDEDITITGNRFNIDSKTDTIVAEGNINIFRPGSLIRSQRAVFDQGNNIIYLFGNVSISDDQVKATSVNAVYDLVSKKVTLTDKAVASRGYNKVYGDTMTILLGQNKILVEGKTKIRIQDAEVQ